MIEGTVTRWVADEGWGSIDLDDARVAFAHFSHISDQEGYRSLEQGQRVKVDVEPADQDGFAWRTTTIIHA